MNARGAIALTARREVEEQLRSRAFRVSTAVQVAIVLVIVAISAITGGDGESYDVGAVGSESVALVEDLSTRTIEDVTIVLDEPGSEAAARSGIEDGELDAALVEGEILAPTDADEQLIGLIQQSAAAAEGTRLLESEGVDEGTIQRALNPSPLTVDEVGEEASSAGVAFVGTLLLYIAILGFGFTLTTAIVEEKTSRVVELILATIRSRQLLAGKLIGFGLLGIAQLALTAGVGLAAALAIGEIDLPSSTAEVTALVLLFFALGYALYACAFAVAGAIISRPEDVGSVTTPMVIVLVGGYLASFSVADDPTGTLATVLTFIPPFAPLVVPARAAYDGLPLGELVVSIVLMLAAIAALIWLAGRVYDRAVLRTGSSLKLVEGLKLARRDL